MDKKLLVVEENEADFITLRDQLIGLNYEDNNIIHYTSVRQAILSVDKDILFIIANLYSKKRDADQCFNALQDYYPGVPIIILAEAGKTDQAVQWVQAGAQDYLTKGEYSVNEFKKAVTLSIARNNLKHPGNVGTPALPAKENEELINVIKKQKEQLDDILSSVSEVIWSRRADDGSLVYINNACEKIYGYTAAELLSDEGKQLKHIHEDDVLKLREEMAETLKRGSGQIEYRIYHKSGEIKNIYGYASVKYSSEGVPKLINGISIDVTTLRRTEQALKEKINEIQDIFESITDTFLSVDKDWHITHANKEFEKLYEVSRTAVIGKNLFTVFPKLVGSQLDIDIRRAMANHCVTHSEGISPSTGKMITVDAYPTKNGLAIYIRDITTQHELRDKLANEEQKLRAIINNTTDIIWSMDRSMEVVSANQAYYDRVAMMTNNKDYSELTENDFGEETMAKWQGFFTRAFNGENYKIIYEDIANGKTVYEEISFNPIQDKDNNIVAVSCFSRDITEQKMLHDQVLMDKQNLKALINNTRDFIWSVDKDLKIVSINDPFVEFIQSVTNKIIGPGDSIISYDFGSEMRQNWLSYYEKALNGKRIVIDSADVINNQTLHTEKRLNPVFDKDGEVVGVSCFSRDISEEVMLRNKIQKDEQSLRATINNTRDFIWSVDKDKNIIFINQAAKELIYQLSNVTPEPGSPALWLNVQDDFLKSHFENYERALQGHVFSTINETLLNGMIIYLETSFNPIKDTAGQIIGVSCFSRDITTQRQYQARIEQQNEKLKEIAWIQSHKVRGPVASILGLIHLFNYADINDPVNIEILNGLKIATTSLDEIIKEVVSKTHNIRSDD